MPAITIQGGSLCAGGNHRTITTDAGTLNLLESELQARPEGFDELKDAFLTVVRHQYLSRRAAGRTHAQALSDLIGFVVRL
jgi:hypothetical protein